LSDVAQDIIDHFSRGEIPSLGKMNEIVIQLNELTRRVSQIEKPGDPDGPPRTALLVRNQNPVAGSTATRYPAKRLVVNAHQVVPPAITMSNIGTAPAVDDSEAWEVSDLAASGLVLGYYIGMKSDGKPIYAVDSGVRGLQYNTTTGKAQFTRNPNPTTATAPAQWIDWMTFDPCTPSSQLRSGDGGNLFNPFGIGGDASVFSETINVNLANPITNTVQLTTATTTTGGTLPIANVATLLDFGLSGGTLYRIRAHATGPTKKGEIRIFHEPNNGGVIFWIGSLNVPETNPLGASDRWSDTWFSDDLTNGLLMGPNDSIYVSTYESDTINVTGVAAEL
jgi:hypothetical protein